MKTYDELTDKEKEEFAEKILDIQYEVALKLNKELHSARQEQFILKKARDQFKQNGI